MVGIYCRKIEEIQGAFGAVYKELCWWLKAPETVDVPQITLRRRARSKEEQVRGTQKGLQ
jgi:hypothetical protein